MALSRIEELENIVSSLSTKIADAVKAVGHYVEDAPVSVHEDLNEAVDYVKTHVSHLEEHLEELLGLKKKKEEEEAAQEEAEAPVAEAPAATEAAAV